VRAQGDWRAWTSFCAVKIEPLDFIHKCFRGDSSSYTESIDKLSIRIAQLESKCQYSPRFTRNIENWPTTGAHRTWFCKAAIKRVC
jgi:hypothetical protein